MISRNEALRMIAWMLKKLGGKVSIPPHELLAMSDYEIQFLGNFNGNYDVTLTRIGKTFEGTAERLHPGASEDCRGVQARHSALPVRRTLLAQEAESEGDREVPSLGCDKVEPK